jgi:hypothetical protein
MIPPDMLKAIPAPLYLGVPRTIPVQNIKLNVSESQLTDTNVKRILHALFLGHLTTQNECLVIKEKTVYD